VATEIYEGERRFQAVVRLPEEFRNSVDQIRGILLRSADGGQIPLDSVAHIDLREGTSQIKREMAKRRIVVGVNVRDRDLGGFVAELQQKGETAGDATFGLLLRVGRAVRKYAARAAAPDHHCADHDRRDPEG